MARFVIARIIGMVAVLLTLAAIVFVIFYASPSNPALLACGKGCQPDRLEAVKHTMGLDQPIYVQFGEFLKGLVVGRDFSTGPSSDHCAAPCLGYSFQYSQSVLALIGERLSVTLSLTFGAVVLWLATSLVAGVVSALFRGRALDRVITVLSIGGIATPTFLFGLGLIMIVCGWLKWLPFPVYVPLTEDPTQWAWNLLLPWIALAAGFAAFYTRIIRGSILDTLTADHVRTERAYGLTERRIVGRHGLRGGLTPVVTMLALDIGGLLAGATLTEKVFGLQGIGSLLVEAVSDKDIPLIVGGTMFAGALVVVFNTIADLVYAVVDPRVTVT